MPTMFPTPAPQPSQPRPSPRWRIASLTLAVLGALALQGCARQDDAALGRELAAKGDHAGAVIALKSAVQAAPDSAELRVLLADALERRHDLPGAEQQLRHAIEHGGDANTLTPRLALLMLDRGEADTLIRNFKDQRLPDPRADAELRGTVALALLTQKRDAAAKAHILGALPVAQVRLAQAQLLAGEGKADSARQALALLKLDDSAAPPPWWLLRAGRRLALAAGEPDLSLQLVRRAHEAVPYHLGLMGEYGEALISAGRADDAGAIRDRLRQRAPQSYWTHYLDALLQYRAGRNDAAHAAALAVLKVAPDHAGSALIAAAIELRDGEPQVAEKRMEALLQKQPASLPALRLLAQAQLRQGRAEAAGPTLQRALALAPADAELLGLRAQSDLAAGRNKEAAAALAQVVAQHPDDADAWLLLARARAAAGDRPGAREALQQGAAHAKDSAVGARVVEMALQLRDPAWAHDYATRLVQQAPQDALARLALGAVQAAQGDNAAARATALAVLDDTPTQPGALSVLTVMSRTPAQRKELMARHARALAAGGAGPQQVLDYVALLRYEPVADATPLAVLEKGVQLYPAAVPLRAALVEQLLRDGQTEPALAAAQTGANQPGAPAAAGELLSATYLRLGQTTQATETLRKLAAEHPSRPELRLQLAGLEARSGRNAEARALLRRLIDERPDDASAYVALAELEAAANPAQALSVARQMGERPGLAAASLLLAGDILGQTDKSAEAMEKYAAAAKAGAAPVANLRTVALLDRTDRRSAAERELAETMRRFPDDARVVGAAAARAQAAGDAARAAELLQRLADKSPGNPVLRNDLAWAQLAAGRPADALPNARRAVVSLPNHPNALHTLGVALAHNGQRDEAIKVLRAASNLAPTMALPRLDLAENLVAAGDKDGARAALRGIDEAQLGARDKNELNRLRGVLGSG